MPVENYEWVYFLTIVEEGSLTKAAQKLFISQPALSQYLSKLEKRLGMQLFHRQKNNDLILTHAGVRYHRYCEEALQLWETARKEMHTRENSATVVIGVAPMKQRPLMDEFCRSRPGMEHFFVQPELAADLPQKVLSGDIHIAFGGYLNEHPQLRYRNLMYREVDLLVPWEHPLAEHSFLKSGNEEKRVKLSQVGDTPFVLLKRPWFLRRLVDDHCERNGVPIRIAEEAPTDYLRRQTAAQKQMATFEIHKFEDGYIPSGLVPVALDPPIYFTSGVFYRKDLELTPQMLQVIEYYCAHALR